MLRIILLIATNIAILLVLSVALWVVENVFGVPLGGGMYGLLVIAAVMGFGGAFISLAISKWMAKRATGAHVITQPRNAREQWLLQTVQRQAQAAGIGMPEVAVYEAPEPNAFATGMNRNASLVAVSSGLLNNMDQREVEAVLGHEITHVSNGDMVTLTLIQGVLNTFVFFLARVVGSLVDGALRGGSSSDQQHGVGAGYYLTVMAAQVVFGVLAAIIVAWFSRRREFRADYGGAKLEGREAMIAALQRLGMARGATTLPKSVQAFGISGHMGKLFSSHPPIEERIAALNAEQTLPSSRGGFSRTAQV